MASAGSLWAAEEAYLKALKLTDNRTPVLCKLGDIQSMLQKVEASIQTFSRVLAVEPDNPKAHYRLARELGRSGDVEAAQRHLHRALEMAPNNPDLLFEYARLHRCSADDRRIDIMGNVLRNTSLNAVERRQVQLALAKTYDDMGRHLDAYEQARTAKRVARLPVHTATKMMRQRSAAALDQTYPPLSPGSTPSNPDGPVFIIGPSTSGKSLIEHTLCAGSPGWHRGYENRCFEEALWRVRKGNSLGLHMFEPLTDVTAPLVRRSFYDVTAKFGVNGKRFICANGGNVFFAGVALQALPDCRVIFCRRRVLDSAVRIYFRLYERDFPHSDNFSNAINYVVLMHQLMDHWRTLFPNRTHQVTYEELVRNPVDEMRAVVRFCNMRADSFTCPMYWHTDELDGWRGYEEQLRKELGDEAVDKHAKLGLASKH